VLFSPFKPFHVKFYAGKTRVGTPYFYPRKWINATPFLAHKATLDYIKSEEKYNELASKMPEFVDWSLLSQYETEDGTKTSHALACTAGGCELT
jgi:hypothetical protein